MDGTRAPRSERPGAVVRVAVHRVGAAAARGGPVDEVVAEEPLEIRVVPPGDGPAVPIAITMRTPGHDFELAAGFALSEQIVGAPAEIRGLRYCTAPGEEQWFNVVDLELARPFDPEAFRRNVYTSSSCGICGRATLDRLRATGLAPPRRGPSIDPNLLRGLPGALRSAQSLFARTGGLHATGIARADGRFSVVREDVGRHNAFDKAVGRLALDGALPASATIAVVSGRASFELVQKAVIAGIPALAAVGAPSHLAVALAREFGILLVGFLRADGFTVYAGEDRLAAGRPAGTPAPSATAADPG
ncbi:MAG TPA: formate dehydrogenase accessory sulfurtransferase FdhD [Thermoplasmata archaeon]|nr:formate dehydrogenase accessory sulfurtransferase FdhD [Thermoplasmata archaeon]